MSFNEFDSTFDGQIIEAVSKLEEGVSLKLSHGRWDIFNRVSPSAVEVENLFLGMKIEGLKLIGETVEVSISPSFSKLYIYVDEASWSGPDAYMWTNSEGFMQVVQWEDFHPE